MAYPLRHAFTLWFRWGACRQWCLRLMSHCCLHFCLPTLTSGCRRMLCLGSELVSWLGCQRMLWSASSRNHPSCRSMPSVVGAYLASEQAAGRMSGPWPCSSSLHTSPVGLVPKGHDGLAWRMIVDLSSPSGRSVNDSISPDLCSLSYPSVDDAVDYVLALGRSTQMVKLDLKNAYRILPVHPGDRRFLGVCWEGQVFIDHCLPFGLRSAPKIFTACSGMDSASSGNSAYHALFG